MRNPFKQLLLAAHPVGSYYWSSEPADPAELFGGKWERVKDRFLLAAGDEYAEAGSEGGEAAVILAAPQIPSHTHGSKALTDFANIRGYSKGSNDTVTGTGGIMSAEQSTWSGAHDGLTGETLNNASRSVLSINATHEHASVGENQPHNNMPPYITAYCWRRTA